MGQSLLSYVCENMVHLSGLCAGKRVCFLCDRNWAFNLLAPNDIYMSYRTANL